MAEDEDIEPNGEMIAWLQGKPEDVWFECVDHINWDSGVPTLVWMASQPQCSQQLAAHLFWLCDPEYFARRFAEGGAFNPHADTDQLFQTILANAKAGRYQPGRIGYRLGRLTHDQWLNLFPGRRDPFGAPAFLFKRFDGAMPRVNANDTPYGNPHVWDLHFGLGTWAGERPGSPKHQPPPLHFTTGYELRHFPERKTPDKPSTEKTPILNPDPQMRLIGALMFFGSMSILGLMAWYRWFS